MFILLPMFLPTVYSLDLESANRTEVINTLHVMNLEKRYIEWNKPNSKCSNGRFCWCIRSFGATSWHATAVRAKRRQRSRAQAHFAEGPSVRMRFLTQNMYGVSDTSFPLDPSDNNHWRGRPKQRDGDHMWTTDDPTVYSRALSAQKKHWSAREWGDLV
jgi:hypothetical protein